MSLADWGLLSRLELTGMEFRVLAAFMSYVPEKGGATAFCTLQEVADMVGSKLPNVSKVVKDLRGRNVVWRERNGRWRVNAWLVFNGDFDSWNTDAEEDPEPVWVRRVHRGTGEVY